MSYGESHFVACVCSLSCGFVVAKSRKIFLRTRDVLRAHGVEVNDSINTKSNKKKHPTSMPKKKKKTTTR